MSYPEWLLCCAGMLSPLILYLLVFAPTIGVFLDERARRKTLRLLHAVAFWAAEPETTE